MRRFAAFLVVVAAFLLAGCSTPASLVRGGPGVGDDCAAPEVPVIPSPAEGGAAAAATRGGQEASNQPVMSDPARIAPATVWNRGAGPNTNSPTTTETRSQAGAPSVNQGLVIPASSNAQNLADNPAIRAILDRLTDLRAAWKQALDRGQPELAKSIAEQMDAAEARLLAASSSASAGGTTYVYDLRGARVSQIVANGSKSGDAPGGAISPDTATAVGAAADKVVDATMKGEPTVIPEGPPSGLPAAK